MMKNVQRIGCLLCCLLMVGGIDGGRGPSLNQLKELRLTTEGRAILDTIAAAEGTFRAGAGGYSMRFPGTTFPSFSWHPREVLGAYVGDKYIYATAAGRYMILERTWNEVAKTLGLRDFSPLNQDLAALHLVCTNGALDDVLNRRVELAVKKLNRTWATFPGAPYGQPMQKMKYLKQVFEAQCAYYERERSWWESGRSSKDKSRVRGVRYEKANKQI